MNYKQNIQNIGIYLKNNKTSKSRKKWCFVMWFTENPKIILLNNCLEQVQIIRPKLQNMETGIYRLCQIRLHKERERSILAHTYLLNTYLTYPEERICECIMSKLHHQVGHMVDLCWIDNREWLLVFYYQGFEVFDVNTRQIIHIIPFPFISKAYYSFTLDQLLLNNSIHILFWDLDFSQPKILINISTPNKSKKGEILKGKEIVAHNPQLAKICRLISGDNSYYGLGKIIYGQKILNCFSMLDREEGLVSILKINRNFIMYSREEPEIGIFDINSRKTILKRKFKITYGNCVFGIYRRIFY